MLAKILTFVRMTGGTRVGDTAHAEIRALGRTPLAAAAELTYIPRIFHMGDLEEAGSEPGTGAEGAWRH